MNSSIHLELPGRLTRGCRVRSELAASFALRIRLSGRVVPVGISPNWSGSIQNTPSFVVGGIMMAR